MHNPQTIQGPLSAKPQKIGDDHHDHHHHHAPSTLYQQSINHMRDALNNVLGAAHTVSECSPQDDEYTQNQLRQLQYEGLRLSHQFNQMLILQQVETGTFAPNINDYDVFDCLEQAVYENSSVLNQLGQDIFLDCDDELSWFFDRALIVTTMNSLIHTMSQYCDKQMVVQAFINHDQLTINLNCDGQLPREALTALNAYTKLGAIGPRSPQMLSLYFAHIAAQTHKHGDTAGHMSVANTNGGCRISLTLP